MMHLKIREEIRLERKTEQRQMSFILDFVHLGRVDASAREKSGSRLTFEAANTRSGRAANA